MRPIKRILAHSVRKPTVSLETYVTYSAWWRRTSRCSRLATCCGSAASSSATWSSFGSKYTPWPSQWSIVTVSSTSTSIGLSHTGQTRSPGPPRTAGRCQGRPVISIAISDSAASSTKQPPQALHSQRFPARCSLVSLHAGQPRARSLSDMALVSPSVSDSHPDWIDKVAQWSRHVGMNPTRVRWKLIRWHERRNRDRRRLEQKVDHIKYARVWVAQGGGFHAPPGNLLLDFGADWHVGYGDEYWRLLTAAFLHMGFWHLAFNLLAIASVGPQVGQIWGR